MGRHGNGRATSSRTIHIKTICIQFVYLFPRVTLTLTQDTKINLMGQQSQFQIALSKPWGESYRARDYSNKQAKGRSGLEILHFFPGWDFHRLYRYHNALQLLARNEGPILCLGRNVRKVSLTVCGAVAIGLRKGGGIRHARKSGMLDSWNPFRKFSELNLTKILKLEVVLNDNTA